MGRGPLITRIDHAGGLLPGGNRNLERRNPTAALSPAGFGGPRAARGFGGQACAPYRNDISVFRGISEIAGSPLSSVAGRGRSSLSLRAERPRGYAATDVPVLFSSTAFAET